MRRKTRVVWRPFFGVVIGSLFVMVAGCNRERGGRLERMVLAEMGGEKITDADLDETIQLQLQRSAWRYQTETYRLRRDALDRVLEKRLLEKEAEARSINVAELLYKEVRMKSGEVSDPEIEAYFKENPDRYSGDLTESLRRRIRLTLQREREGELKEAFLEGLKEKYGVEVFLEYPTEPRFEVRGADDPAQGPPDAPVQVVEFGDYTSPITKEWNALRKSVVEQYGGKIRWIYRDAPKRMDSIAGRAAMAANCAGVQGKFWRYHDLLMKRETLEEDDLEAIGKALELDIDRFNECLSSERFKDEILEDARDSRRTGSGFPPALYINGILVDRNLTLAEIEQIIQKEL